MPINTNNNSIFTTNNIFMRQAIIPNFVLAAFLTAASSSLTEAI